MWCIYGGEDLTYFLSGGHYCCAVLCCASMVYALQCTGGLSSVYRLSSVSVYRLVLVFVFVVFARLFLV